MKIIELCPRTPRTHGAGIEYHAMLISKYLKKNGVEIEIVTTAKEPKGKIEYEGILLNEFEVFSPNDSYFFSWKIFNYLKKTDADIIHCHGFNNLVSPIGILSKKNNQKIILTLHSSGSSSAFRRLLHLPLILFYRLTIHKIEKIVCVSEWEKKEFQKMFNCSPEKFIVIPTGIDDRFFSIKREPQSNIILSVGRLVKNKGMHRLVSAMKFLVKKNPSIQLHIIGDGVERENLFTQAKEEGVSSNVFFHGNIPRDRLNDLLKWYSIAGVFVLLSDFESQGIVLGEAIASDIPVMTTTIGVMGEYVKQGLAVGIERPDNPIYVAEKISRMLDYGYFYLLQKDFDVELFVPRQQDTGKAVLKLYEKVLMPPNGTLRGAGLYT